ncbi:MAG: tetratricopeptide repeat protein, partial [Puniceicoccales bacterium]
SDVRKAYFFLRSGVVHNPTNLEGRSMLSEFSLLAKRPPEDAISIMRGGIPYAGNDKEYLKRYIQMLLRYQQDQEVMDVADNLLSKDPGPEVQRLLALAAATAHYYRGDFDQAEDYVRDYDLDDDLEGTLLSANISWDRGQQQAAISKLESSLGKYPNDEPVYALMSRFYRDMGEHAKARRYAVLRNINSPLSVTPRIDLLYSLDNTDQQERADREAETILHQFGDNEKALIALANYATDSGRVDLARRIYETALENDFNIAPFALLLVEAHITSSDYQGAINFTEELAKEKPEWMERNLGVFNSLRAVAYYGIGNKDYSDIYLEQFLKQSSVRVDTLIAVSRRFVDLGGKEQARKILTKAIETNSDNQAALSRLIELEIDMGNSAQLGTYLKKLLQMRRPSADLLMKAYRSLGSDRFIYTQDRETLLIELDTIIHPEKQRPS